MRTPPHPQWVYRKGTGCLVCNAGDPLSLDEYAKSLSEFGLERPKRDMAYTPEMVTLVSERTLELIREFGNSTSKLRWYPVATVPSARKSRRDQESFYIFEVTQLVGGPLVESTDIRTQTCQSCSRVTSRVHKQAIHIRKSDLPEADIFRSQELLGNGTYCDWMSPLEFISRRLADALKVVKITGYYLEPCILV